MECNFVVGQKVVCVNEDADIYKRPGLLYRGDLDGLRTGSVYTVRQIFFCVRHYRTMICLDEIRRRTQPETSQEYGFDYRRFRPLTTRKTDISIFTNMLRDVHADA